MPLRALTRSAALLAGCAALSGCGSGAGTHTAATHTTGTGAHTSGPAAPTTTAGTASGREVFSQACAACHSVSGHNSPRQQGGDLLHFHSTRAQLIQLTREMPILHHRLSDSEVAAVVSYLRVVESRG
ncbi:MAG: cytochrome c [Solirubrobacteraceae bacterium]